MRPRFVSADELDYYRNHFLEALREDGVVCLECGRLCAHLGCHVRVHGLILEAYKEKWGYDRKRELISSQYREVMRANALARNLAALAPPDVLALAHVSNRSGR